MWTASPPRLDGGLARTNGQAQSISLRTAKALNLIVTTAPRSGVRLRARAAVRFRIHRAPTSKHCDPMAPSFAYLIRACHLARVREKRDAGARPFSIPWWRTVHGSMSIAGMSQTKSGYQRLKSVSLRVSIVLL